MTIYDIDKEIERILSEVDENGELPEGAFEELTKLTADREVRLKTRPAW